MDVESVSNLGDSSSCALCHTILTSENEADELDAFSVCGDCKLLMEDFDTASPEVYNRRGVSRRRFDSSESMESMFMFSQQFSHMISLARQNPSNDDAHSVDGVRSRRWRRVLSDNESDGFDSVYGESESLNGRYNNRAIDSDGLDTDNDIDPMNAGTFQWNSDDSEWDEAEAEAQPNILINWGSQLVIEAHIGDLEESYVGNSGDYLDARGFEDLLDHLAENNQSSRRGAPPASLSFVNNLPCLTINGDKQQQECAICKDSFTLGTRVNELPCLHLYHPSCILPWLAARNTCPLCRYELPTDDKERNESQLIDDTDAAPVDQVEVEDDAPRNRWFFLAAPIVSILGISLILWRPPRRRDNNQRRWYSLF
ncbi:hypothetical protein SASPL_101900 [Salvia splendens]|uniref:RING-type E3 ubiquitin transferase n=2 Tax=Salvia splendens TaxID=180675 RepID=A0A8X9ACX2_SALSN|nr:hypothetical protein SASPL_101900 [Salvia splendens]